MSARVGRLAVAIAVAIATARPARLVAQLPTTVSAVVGLVEHQTTLAGTESNSGPIFGADVLIAPLRYTEFEGGFTYGSLSGSGETVTWTDIQLSGSALATSWLAFRLGFDLRGYSEALGQQRWFSVAAGAEGRVPLFDGAAHALFRVSLLPIVSVSGQPRPDFSIATTTGVQFERAPLAGSVLFTFERYNFPTTNGISRSDQIAMLGLALGLHFPRR